MTNLQVTRGRDVTQEHKVRFRFFTFTAFCGLFAVTIPTHAVTAGQVAEECVKGNQTCYAYIHGFNSGTNFLLMEVAERSGHKDFTKHRTAMQRKFSYHCAPDLEAKQFAKPFIKYVTETPGAADFPVGYVFHAMLRKAFPCSK